MTYQK